MMVFGSMHIQTNESLISTINFMPFTKKEFHTWSIVQIVIVIDLPLNFLIK